MSGYSKLYCLGRPGGFQGADGITGIYMQILVGDADRQWLEPLYVDRKIKPLNGIRSIIPEGPDHPDSLIDALIAFYPDHFRGCPSFESVRRQLELSGANSLDFHLHSDAIPREWRQLRAEARPLLESLTVFQAELRELPLVAD